jgi:hypothetical protein
MIPPGERGPEPACSAAVKVDRFRRLKFSVLQSTNQSFVCSRQQISYNIVGLSLRKRTFPQGYEESSGHRESLSRVADDPGPNGCITSAKRAALHSSARTPRPSALSLTPSRPPPHLIEEVLQKDHVVVRSLLLRRDEGNKAFTIRDRCPDSDETPYPQALSRTIAVACQGQSELPLIAQYGSNGLSPSSLLQSTDALKGLPGRMAYAFRA